MKTIILKKTKTNIITERQGKKNKEKKKDANWHRTKPVWKVHTWIFICSSHEHFPPNFLPIMVGMNRKHSGSTNFFSLPSPNQTSTKNIFSPFSIPPKIFLTKQTLRVVTKKVMVLEQLKYSSSVDAHLLNFYIYLTNVRITISFPL